MIDLATKRHVQCKLPWAKGNGIIQRGKGLVGASDPYSGQRVEGEGKVQGRSEDGRRDLGKGAQWCECRRGWRRMVEWIGRRLAVEFFYRDIQTE